MDVVFDFIRDKFKIIALAVIGGFLALSIVPLFASIFGDPGRMVFADILYLVFFILVFGGAVLAVVMDSEKALLITLAIIISYSLFMLASEFPTAMAMGGGWGGYSEKDFLYIMWWVFAMIAMIATIGAVAICLLGKIFDGLSSLDFLVGILVLAACGSFFLCKVWFFFLAVTKGNPAWVQFFGFFADMVLPFVVLVAYAKLEKKLA